MEEIVGELVGSSDEFDIFCYFFGSAEMKHRPIRPFQAPHREGMVWSVLKLFRLEKRQGTSPTVREENLLWKYRNAKQGALLLYVRVGGPN